MIGEIITAIMGELEMLFDGTEIALLYDTHFKGNQMPVHTNPFVVLGLANSPDVSQLIGGSIRADWDISITAVTWEFNAENAPDGGYSSLLQNIVDTIKDHFGLQEWLTQAIKDIITNNSFRMTLNGIGQDNQYQKPDAGNSIGFVINYSCSAMDFATDYTPKSTSKLTTIVPHLNH